MVMDRSDQRDFTSKDHPDADLLGMRRAGPMLCELQPIKTHPAFPMALQGALKGVVQTYASYTDANILLNDRGKYLISVFCLALHATHDPGDPRSGLTAERLRRLCEDTGLCSRGRALAIISLLRHKGHLVTAPATGDGRVKRMLPTPTMMALHRARMMRQFASAARILPDLASILQDLDSDAAVLASALSHMDLFSAGWRIMEYAPGIARLAENSATFLLMGHLMQEALGTGPIEALPRQLTVRTNISALAKITGVSRKHILKMLTLAEELGLVHRVAKGGSRLELNEQMISETENFFASSFLQHAVIARMTVARLRADGTA
jgi:hypothetical protein